MPVQWAGLAPPLLVDVRRGTGLPLRAQLEGGLRDAIRSGRLPVGERLPSSRELARQLGLSRGLVQECYGQLQAEGYLTSVVGSGTRVNRSTSGSWIRSCIPAACADVVGTRRIGGADTR